MDTSYIDTVKTLLQRRSEVFADGIKSGEFQPLVFPRDFASFFIVVFALLIKWPRNGPVKYIKYLLYFYSVYLNIRVIVLCRSLLVLGGYGVGLIFSWLSIWGASLLLFNDVQGTYKRIERSFVPFHTLKQDSLQAQSVKHGRNRAGLEDPQAQYNVSNGRANGTAVCTDLKIVPRFKWQGYPEALGHRFTWVFDILFSHRGPHWNWRPRDFPRLPKHVQLQLAHGEDAELNGDLLREGENTKGKLVVSLYMSLVYFLCLDLLKVISTWDRYFLGHLNYPPPSLLAFCGRLAPIIAYLSRLAISGAAIYFAVLFPTTICATVFLAISQTSFRFKTRIPFEAPFLYPPYFGDMWAPILDGGLVGFWGTFWHKHFRAGFLAPGNWIKSKLMSMYPGREWPPLMFWSLQVIISFTLSGIVHCSGSYTQMASTKPFNQFLFFTLQIVGVFIQVSIEKLSKRVMPFKVPLWLKRLSKGTFVLVWMACVSPLLCDDFTAGGVWIEEPIPYSPIRAMGFAKGTGGAVRWQAEPLRWWKGERWWERGIIL
ncbi:hypothetical protein MGYG_03723 [Nannizzia gypsea CBS 118893]|uniref:Wax synthase domain-containing protein n=1 Tax=Arthroderma gypseum (strain ATCC MYA-4604 / CBS 118893) TaxID=535722 RepID=E4UTK9_ARTGP|nr:hypothetical protein MGYG_03723 [Nannizzia gypsea CBS 118893]EFR00718.1 hypothetical protein MGYG_03723 [Nannizzia gypsea CBS 118893]